MKEQGENLVEWIRQNCRNLLLIDISVEIQFFMICVDRCFLFQLLLQVGKTFRSWKNELKHDCAFFIFRIFQVFDISTENM